MLNNTIKLVIRSAKPLKLINFNEEFIAHATRQNADVKSNI